MKCYDLTLMSPLIITSEKSCWLDRISFALRERSYTKMIAFRMSSRIRRNISRLSSSPHLQPNSIFIHSVTIFISFQYKCVQMYVHVILATFWNRSIAPFFCSARKSRSDRWPKWRHCGCFVTFCWLEICKKRTCLKNPQTSKLFQQSHASDAYQQISLKIFWKFLLNWNWGISCFNLKK